MSNELKPKGYQILASLFPENILKSTEKGLIILKFVIDDDHRPETCWINLMNLSDKILKFFYLGHRKRPFFSLEGFNEVGEPIYIGINFKDFFRALDIKDKKKFLFVLDLIS